MTEEKINAFRQTDTNLRDALKMDEAERPQMPADLNERLMQHMATRAKKPRRIVIWPWIAAACVAGVMMIWLTPPKEEITDVVVAENTPKVELPVADEAEPAKVEEAPKEIKAIKAVKRIAVKSEKPLLAQETKTEDIPITRPENYKYTPEELALMKKQANEAYLKWVELEMEIAKNNLEQTAQK